MISVILYGRNDAHGYNLHRRAALSLNCLAEVLTDPDDEIVFVDYNTPDELPTFIEAIADTLTERCLDVLRVLRVPAAIHEQRFASRTHLTAIEPVSRNAAVRRANPANRWLLSTNTDMLFVPLTGTSLSETCIDLPDGYYGLPRFELPEWLWERLPRSDPTGVLADLARLGPALRLDEPTAHHEWIRFDAPGDFQLILRRHFDAVDGFDERMLLGYHVDANLSRRMLLYRGSIESLEERVAGYHCNHNRVPTVYHGEQAVGNDLDRFYFGVSRADVPDQRSSWGLSDVTIEEVPIREHVTLAVADRVGSVLPKGSSNRASSDARASALGLTYDSNHVLPFVADSLVVSPSTVSVAYIGANPVLRSLLAALVGALGFDNPLNVVDVSNRDSVDRVDEDADVIVVDLGVDTSLVDASAGDQAATDYWANEFPRGLDGVLLALDRLIQLERARITRGEHPRRIVLVNSTTMYWDAYIVTQMDCSYTSFHSRVRRATVKPAANRGNASIAAREFARRLLPWSARPRNGKGRLRLRVGAIVRIADLSDFAGFGSGWAFPDGFGIWTQGNRSELAMSLDRIEGEAVLSLGIGGVCIAPGESLSVQILVNNVPVAVRDFGVDAGTVRMSAVRRPLPERAAQRAVRTVPYGLLKRFRPLYVRLTAHPAAPGAPQFTETLWPIVLPASIVSRGEIHLTLAVDEPRTPFEVGWSVDERPIGIHLRSLKLE